MAKSFPDRSSVISFPAPEAKVVVPVTEMFPMSVIVPLAVMLKSPDTVEVLNTIAFVSTKVTLFPLVMNTAPPKLFPA